MSPAAHRRPKLPVDAAPDAAQIVAEAEEEIRAAEELAATLEAAVSSGDEAVTPDDIDKAHSRARWARLRLPAAREKAVQIEAERRAAERAALVSRHRDALRGKFAEVSADAMAARDLIQKLLASAHGADLHIKALRHLADGMHNPHHPADSAGLVMNGSAGDGGVYVDGEQFPALDVEKLRAAVDELDWLARRAVPAESAQA